MEWKESEGNRTDSRRKEQGRGGGPAVGKHACSERWSGKV